MSDKNNWVKIYNTTNNFEGTILEGKLKEAGIPVQVISKQDSMYKQFDFLVNVEIYVPKEEAFNAVKLINVEVD